MTITLRCCESADAVADAAREEVARLLAGTPQPVIALPTGATPLPLYERLARDARRKTLPLDRVEWFALDEFAGPGVPRRATFRHFLETLFFGPAELSTQRLHTLRGDADDPSAEGARYEAAIEAAGGLDLAILGIGGNGHIAFNEPGTPLDSPCGQRPLTPATRAANAYLFTDGAAPPLHGLTMGIGTIRRARRVLLLATGRAKAPVLGRLARLDQPDPALPASALINHPDCLFLLDPAAAAKLPKQP